MTQAGENFVSGIGELLQGAAAQVLEQRLVTWLPRQRWFGAKSRTIKGVEIADAAELPGLNAALVFLQLTYDDDSTGIYQVPLAISASDEAISPASIVTEVATASGLAVVHDALMREDVRQAILNLIATNGEIPSRRGILRGRRSSAFDAVRGEEPLPARTGSAEQSNSSILYGSKLIMKLFRRMQPGENPDTEIGRFLTQTARFPRIAAFLGDISLVLGDGEPTTLAMLQGLVANDGDGWEWTLAELSHAYERAASLRLPRNFSPVNEELSSEAGEFVGDSLAAAALLGQRTAEMHLALATPTENPAFQAEPFTGEDLAADAARIETQLTLSLAALERGMSRLEDSAAVDAAVVLSRREILFSRARALPAASASGFGQRIRIHGDYHLGQVLRSRGDYVILDFEGEPARTLAARRAKQSPLKDVAGMLRSYSYAAYAGLNASPHAKDLEPWAALWRDSVSAEFLRSYRATVEAADPRLLAQPAEAQTLLDAYLLEKALYELLYELNNRPAWVRIPLSGILALLESKSGS